MVASRELIADAVPNYPRDGMQARYQDGGAQCDEATGPESRPQHPPERQPTSGEASMKLG